MITSVNSVNLDIPTDMFDFQLIYDLAVRDYAHPGATFVEIGSALGESTLHLMNAIDDKGLTGQMDVFPVDIWEKMEFVCQPQATKVVSDISKQHGVYIAFLAIMRKHDVLDKITPLRMPSAVAAKLFDDNSVDFVFVDGNHTYPYVKKDLEVWIPKIRNGGLIAGHDFNDWEVAKAVSEFIPKSALSLYEQKDTTEVLQGIVASWASVKRADKWEKWLSLEEAVNNKEER